MQSGTRRTRATWIVGLGVGLGGGLLWACSSSSAPAGLGAREGNDSAAPVTDASVADTSTPSEGAAPLCTVVEGGCGAVPNCGTKVNIVQVAQTPPMSSGGTVVPGTYVMTDFSIFTGTGGASGAMGAWEIETQYLSLMGSDAGAPTEAGAGDEGGADDGGTGTGDAGAAAEAGPVSQVFQLLDVSESDTKPAETLTGTTTFSGAQGAAIVYDCPSGTPTFFSTYTATSTQFQLFANESAGVLVITYTKM